MSGEGSVCTSIALSDDVDNIQCLGTGGHEQTNRSNRAEVPPFGGCSTCEGREVQHSMGVQVRLRGHDHRSIGESEKGEAQELWLLERGANGEELQRENDTERVCVCEEAWSPPSTPPDGEGERAHIGHGGSVGEEADGRGRGAPLEWGQGGQPPREFGVVDKKSASGGACFGQDSVGCGTAGGLRAAGAKPHDPVNHPKHYTSSPARCLCGAGIECIQITEHMNFCLGNALKYIWRADLKGSGSEDLKKAAWYLQREIERREAK